MVKPQNKIKFSLTLVLIIFMVIKVFFHAPVVNDYTKNSFWISKTHSKDKFDVVIGGDSRIYRGFSAAYFEKTSELRAMNLGYSSAGYSAQYFDFLRSKLDADSKNKFMILGITANSMVRSASKNGHFNQWLKKSRFEVFKGRFLDKYLSYFAPYRMVNLLKRRKPGKHPRFNADGWVASGSLRIDSSRTINSYIESFSKYKVDKWVYMTFMEQIDTTLSKGIEIIAFRPPTTQEMRILEDTMGGFYEQKLITELRAKGVHWIDLNFNDYVSYDGSHLEEESAIKLSKYVAEYINQLSK